MPPTLWVGTDGGLARLDKSGHWQTYSTANTQGGLPDDHVSALALGAGGALWVGTFGGLARLDKDGHWQSYSTASTQGGLPNDHVWALAVGADGALWAGTSNIHGGVSGLARRDKDGHWQTYNRANTQAGLPNDIVRALALGADGALWAGTAGGLARRDQDGHWQSYSQASTPGGLPNDDICALALGADGALWVGTSGGLARRDKDGHWQSYSTASTQGGLPGDDVCELALGADGSLWAGTAGGLGNFNRPLGRMIRIVDVIGKVGEVTQAEQTIAVTAFDDSYLTQPGMFHYIWRLDEGPEIPTRSSAHKVDLPSVMARIGFALSPSIAMATGATRRTSTSS